MSNNLDDVRIRQAILTDLDKLQDFITPFVEQNKILPRTVDELNLLAHSGFVALKGDELIGFAALEIYSPKLAEIRSLVVQDEWQGIGVGKKLVQSCVDMARNKNILEVMVVTASDDFFQSCGFDYTLPGQKKALFMQTRE
ncbi:acetyltransferase [Polystyrenella longa]|uniref:Acetyltransferase n=1 Tax=Polystyrenella longa TaxID=2528007 RepID=A0A518CPG4_9PLAN|nr:GNAT family N-acetyltransferase [Polystyrenella longa]QDU81109.1 acetyltransferase [Polystyrenella longa]